MRVQKELKPLRSPKSERIKKLYQKKTTQKCKACVTACLQELPTAWRRAAGGICGRGHVLPQFTPPGQRPLHGGEFHVTKTSAIEELCNY